MRRIPSGISYITAIFRSEEGDGAPVVTYEYEQQSGPGIRLSAIVANGQRWTYSYEAVQGYAYDHYQHLVSVQRPDGRAWTYAYNPAPHDPNPNDGVAEIAPGAHSLRQMQYPFGATVDYTYGYVQFDPGSALKTTTIATKVVSGSGVPNGQWQFAYAPHSRPYTTSNGYQLRYDVTTITAPQAIYRYVHHGKDFAGLPNGGNVAIRPSHVGLLAFKEIYSASNVLLERYAYSWTERLVSPENYFHGAGYRSWWVENGTYAPMLAAEAYSRDGFGTETEYAHVKRYFGYDAYGNPGRVYENVNLTEQSARQTLYTYRNDTSRWILGLPLTQTHQTVASADDPSGTTVGEITRTYYPHGKVESESRFGVRTEYTYTSSGDVASVKDARGYTRRYSNYKRGIAQREELPESVVLLRSVNDTGTLQSETNGRGFTTSYAYDDLNRLTSIDYPVGADVSIAYGQQGGYMRRSLSRDNYRQVDLINDFGQTTQVERTDAQTGLTISKTMGFDALGRATFVSYPNATIGITTAYDALGRVSRTTHPDSNYVQYSYFDQQVTVRNERAKSTTYLYRTFGMETAALEPYLISQPMSVATLIDRDIFGNTLRVFQGTISNGVITGNAKTFEYDSHLFLTRATEPEVGSTVFTHDAIGNVLTETVNQEPSATFTWDGLGRRTAIDFADGTPDVATVYDRNGNVIETSKGTSRWNYAYDENDNLLTETLTAHDPWYGPRSYVVAYAYSPMDVVSSVTYPSGLQVPYAPDAFGRATRAGTFASNIQYHPSGQLKSYVLGNGVTTSVELDARLLTKRIQSGFLVDLNFTYDPSGNTASVIDGIGSDSYTNITYDDLDRLSSTDNRIFQAQYDALGNFQSRRNLNYRFAYTMDTQSRLAQIDQIDPIDNQVRQMTHFGYDARGNMVSKSALEVGSGGTQGFSRSKRSRLRFDSASQLVAAEITDSRSTTGVAKRAYAYDGNGMRYAERQGKGHALQHSIYGFSKALLFEDSLAECARTDIILLGALNIARSRDVFANAQADSDGDGLNDCIETQVGLNPQLAADAAGDLDADGLSNLAEFTAGSSPLYGDTDGDGLADALEAQRGTDPFSPDGDGDGLSDQQELADSRLNPNAADSDHDGVTDDWELRLGSHPGDPLDATADFDGDGFSNRQERSVNLDPMRREQFPSRGIVGVRHDVGGAVSAAPAIGRDGVIYLSHMQNQAHAAALYPDGTQRWKHSNVGMEPSPVTVAQDGTVYYWLRVLSGSSGNRSFVYARNPDGSLRWTYGTSAYLVSPISIGRNGELLMGGYGDTAGTMLTLSRDGALLRRKSLPDYMSTAAVVAPDGSTYVTSNQGTVHAFGADGANLWMYPLRGKPAAELSIGHGGVVFAHDAQGYTYALRPDGTLLWEQQYSTTAPRSAVIVGQNGVLYLGTSAGQLLALRESDGGQLWSATISSNQILTPALGKDGTVYGVSTGGRVSAFDSTGSQLWTMLSGSLMSASPVIDRDGTLYLGTLSGQVLAVVDRSGGVAFTRWPMHRHDLAGSSFQCFNSDTFNHNADSDGDGIGDCDELVYGMDPADPNDGALDFDGDGLSNAQESAAGTRLTVPDTDGDGLSDGQEVLTFHTNPLATDTDTDMLSDAYEIQYRLNPLDAADALADADGDGFSNRQEMLAGTNPVGSASVPTTGSVGRTINAPGAPVRQPALHPDGTIYVNGANGLEAINKDLSLRWSFDTPVYGQVTIGNNGMIYAVTRLSGELVALYPDTGALWWRYRVDDGSGVTAHTFDGPVIANDGSVYVSYLTGSSFTNPTVVRFNASGGVRQYTNIRGSVGTIPGRLSFDRQGNLLVASNGLISLRAENFQFNWQALTQYSPGKATSIAVVDSAGVIYATQGQRLSAVSPLDGAALWLVDGVSGQPIITEDGLIVATCASNGQLCAFNASGTLVWQTQGSHSLLGAAAVDANNVIHQVTSNGQYLRISAAGQVLSQSAIATIDSFEYPLVLPDGMVYLGMRDVSLLLLNAAIGDVTSPWPCRNRDSMNRRNALTAPVGSPPQGPAITYSYAPPRAMSYGFDVVVTAQATDVVDGNVTSSIRWSSNLDGALGQGASVRLQPLRAGTHTISATAVDSQGNSTTSDFKIQVIRQSATLNVIEPFDFSSIAETNYPVQFRATASDVVDGDISHLITWTSNRDGVLGTGGTISVALSAGTHTVDISVVNSGGETSSTAREVQVSRWPPTVTITAPRNNTSVVRGTAVTFTGTATDLVDGNLGAQLTWRSSRDGLLYVGPTFTTSALTVGTHTIRAEATDSHGQLTRAQITVRVTASASAAAEDSSSVDTANTEGAL